MYIPNDDTQNYPLRLKLEVKLFDIELLNNQPIKIN